jgi:hypothetical protein
VNVAKDDASLAKACTNAAFVLADAAMVPINARNADGITAN